MILKKYYLAIFTFIAISFNVVECIEREMTIQVNARERECFYETIEKDHIIDIEYQVS
jgi:hypothetical protein